MDRLEEKEETIVYPSNKGDGTERVFVKTQNIEIALSSNLMIIKDLIPLAERLINNFREKQGGKKNISYIN